LIKELGRLGGHAGSEAVEIVSTMYPNLLLTTLPASSIVYSVSLVAYLVNFCAGTTH